MDVLQSIFRELVAPMPPDYDIEEMGYWEATDHRRFYYIVRHASVDAIAANWDRFHADPRWVSGLADREHGTKVVEGTQSIALRTVPGLPPAETPSRGVRPLARSVLVGHAAAA